MLLSCVNIQTQFALSFQNLNIFYFAMHKKKFFIFNFYFGQICSYITSIRAFTSKFLFENAKKKFYAFMPHNFAATQPQITL